MMYEFEKPFVVDSSKFERAFGMQATPLRTAVRKTVEWYRAHPAPMHKDANPNNFVTIFAENP
jgi:dTDP-D-glucose 4,6-dehydratase